MSTITVPTATELGAVAPEVATTRKNLGDPDPRLANAIIELATQVKSDVEALESGGGGGEGGGSTWRVGESIYLVEGYTAEQSAELAGPYSAGSPINASSASLFGSRFTNAVPMVVVGNSPGAAITDSPDPLTTNGNGVNLGATVTFTLTGTDIAGNALVRTVTTSKQGAFSFQRAFKTATSFTSSAAVSVAVQINTGKGFATATPFQDNSLELSLTQPLLDTPAVKDGATGTIIPSGAYNASEGFVFCRYLPAVS